MPLHHRYAHQHEEQCNRKGTHCGPPEGGVRRESEEIEPPPEEHFAEIVRVPGPCPQSPLQYLLRLMAGSQEFAKLPVRAGLDPDGQNRDRRGREVQKAEMEEGGGEHGVEGKAPQEYEHGRKEVKPEEADDPIGRGPETSEVAVAPVLVPQTAPAARPIGGEPDRPCAQEDHHENRAQACRVSVRGAVHRPENGNGNRSRAPVRVIDAGVVEQQASCEDEHCRRNVGGRGLEDGSGQVEPGGEQAGGGCRYDIDRCAGDEGARPRGAPAHALFLLIPWCAGKALFASSK